MYRLSIPVLAVLCSTSASAEQSYGGFFSTISTITTNQPDVDIFYATFDGDKLDNDLGEAIAGDAGLDETFLYAEACDIDEDDCMSITTRSDDGAMVSHIIVAETCSTSDDFCYGGYLQASEIIDKNTHSATSSGATQMDVDTEIRVIQYSMLAAAMGRNPYSMETSTTLEGTMTFGSSSASVDVAIYDGEGNELEYLGWTMSASSDGDGPTCLEQAKAIEDQLRLESAAHADEMGVYYSLASLGLGVALIPTMGPGGMAVAAGCVGFSQMVVKSLKSSGAARAHKVGQDAYEICTDLSGEVIEVEDALADRTEELTVDSVDGACPEGSYYGAFAYNYECDSDTDTSNSMSENDDVWGEEIIVYEEGDGTCTEVAWACILI